MRLSNVVGVLVLSAVVLLSSTLMAQSNPGEAFKSIKWDYIGPPGATKEGAEFIQGKNSGEQVKNAISEFVRLLHASAEMQLELEKLSNSSLTEQALKEQVEKMWEASHNRSVVARNIYMQLKDEWRKLRVSSKNTDKNTAFRADDYLALIGRVEGVFEKSDANKAERKYSSFTAKTAKELSVDLINLPQIKGRLMFIEKFMSKK